MNLVANNINIQYRVIRAEREDSGRQSSAGVKERMSNRDDSSSVVKTPIVIVCLLVNYPRRVALAQAENKSRAVARVFRGEGGRRVSEEGRDGGREGLKCFLPLCAPRVTKSTTDAGPDKSSRGSARFLFFPLR